jgi:hypothetical protein
MKLSPVQLKTLEMLASSGEPLIYFRGGYWTLPGLGNGPKPFWYVTTGTVLALGKMSLLASLEDSSNYTRDFCPALADRVLTDEGRAAARKE